MKKLWGYCAGFFLVVLGFRVLIDTIYQAWPVLLVLAIMATVLYLALGGRYFFWR